MPKAIVQKSEDAIKTFHLISNLTVKNIIDFLKNGPAPPSKIARELNISVSTSSRCLQELRKYNIVEAKWKTTSVDERPLKIYKLVPNILRFEYLIKSPKEIIHEPDSILELSCDCFSEFREEEKRGVYVSLEDVPFRFSGIEADIIKECYNGIKFKDIEKKFEGNEKFLPSLKKLFSMGLIKLSKT